MENDIKAQALKAGDCVSYTAASVVRTSCAGTFDASVAQVIELTMASYPGESAVIAQAEQDCPAGAEMYTYPTEASWSLGDRQIACLDETP
jgi:hypothetical protein